MTWAIAWGIARRFWPLAVIAAILGYHWIALGRARDAGRDEVQAKWDQSINDRKQESDREQDSAVHTYRLELGSGADLEPVVLRLCTPATIFAEATAADGTGGAAAPTGSVSAVSEGAGGLRDIGPRADALMRRADQVSARLRAVQGLH